MSATQGTRLGVFNGASVIDAFDNDPQQSDLLHIVGQGNTPLIKVDHAGVVTKNPSTHTSGTRLGKFAAFAANSSSSIASMFAVAFPNNVLDIFQVESDIEEPASSVSTGGKVPIYWLDYTGTANKLLRSIALTPTGRSVSLGGTDTVQLTATGTYSDGSTANLTSVATWSTSNSLKVTVAAGLCTGVAIGSASITASYSGITSSGDTVTVTA